MHSVMDPDMILPFIIYPFHALSREKYGSPVLGPPLPELPCCFHVSPEAKIGVGSSEAALECDCPPTPKPRKEGKPKQIVQGPYSNVLESL